MSDEHRHTQERINSLLQDMQRDDLRAAHSDSCWQVPEGYFETATEQWESSPWEVPSEYFESHAYVVPSRKTVAILQLRWTAVAAAALVLIGLASILFWRLNQGRQPSFAELVEQYPPEYDDLLEMDGEYITEVYLDEMTDTDTLVQDTLTAQAQVATTAPSILDPKTGLPAEKVEGLKVRWEDITDEDIMEYLEKNDQEELIIEE